jgi:hypothetical protein
MYMMPMGGGMTVGLIRPDDLRVRLGEAGRGRVVPEIENGIGNIEAPDQILEEGSLVLEVPSIGV